MFVGWKIPSKEKKITINGRVGSVECMVQYYKLPCTVEGDAS